MLKLDGSIDTQAATIFPDDREELLFYVLPKVPTLRRDANGKAAFKFIKYRNVKPWPNGKNGAALAFMDVELALLPADEPGVRQTLADKVNQRRGQANPNRVRPEDIQLAKPPITDASVTVDVLSGDGNLVQRVNTPAKPSMYGNNVVALAIELTQEGAPVFAGAMKTDGAGGVKVNYRMNFSARMPPVTATGTWVAHKFYQFVQEVDFEENFWSEDDFSEKVSELFVNSESRVVVVDPGGLPNTDPNVVKILDILRASMTQQLDEAVKRNLIEAIPPENRDFSKIRDDDFENIRREVTVNKISDVRMAYQENQVFAMEVWPQSNMPSMKGQGFNWDDYAVEIDVDDPFFKLFQLNIQVNAEFSRLPIFSVDVSVDYPPHTARSGVKTFSFRKADDIGKFEAFMDGGGTAFKYKYVVHYVGESRIFDSGWREHNGNDLKVDVDELGLWLVDIEVGDMNWNQVARAVLTLEHPPVASGVPPVSRFQIDANTKTLQVRELLLEPVKPYGGSVKFFMKDGREFVRQLADLKGQRFYVDDPFSANREVLVRTRGDYDKVIDTIFLDLSYVDDVNGYEQSVSYALSKNLRFQTWTFPAIDPNGGKLSYRATTTFRDGTSSESGEQVLTGKTLLLGVDSAVLEIDLLPDLIPWQQVKLAKVDLHYADPANNIDERESVTFRVGAAERTVVFALRSLTLKSYEWTATFFMNDGTKRIAKSAGRVTDETLVLELPSA